MLMARRLLTEPHLFGSKHPVHTEGDIVLDEMVQVIVVVYCDCSLASASE